MSTFDIIATDEKSAEKQDESIEILADAVKDLYKFRDHYFEYHDIKDAIKRTKDIEEKLQQILILFDTHKDCASKHRAKYYYLKGYALNIVSEYSKEAEDLLSKAVKLDPKLVAAWNELGDCFCKKNNLTEATNCYNKALSYEKNAVSLRNLSILAREKAAKSREERIANIEQGLQFAKDAVQLDAQDGQSWTILGNAHLSSFFGISQNPKILKCCLSAYNQAEKDPVASNTPDLHYNKAIILKFEEEYLQALQSFERAVMLDPTWQVPKTKQSQLIRYLKDISEFVATSGKLKAKKLQQLLQTIDSKQLGPYSGGNYTSKTTGQSINLKEVQLKDLKTGINTEVVVLGKVVCSVRNEDGVPFTFCLVDKVGTCVVATVFNLADGKGVIIGDSVAIPEPYVTDVDFKYGDNEFKFRLLRIETPVVMVVNGKKASRDLQASVQMSLFKKFD